MCAAVRIKVGKYDSAIGLLFEPGDAVHTRRERTLIVDAAQKQALKQAGLIEAVGLKPSIRHGPWPARKMRLIASARVSMS